MPGVLPPGRPGNWTLYNADGEAAVPFDTFIACTVKSENKVAQNPTEKGSFADYNKVASPISVGLILARSGPSDELAQTLNALDRLVESTELLSVVTPEKTFLDFNLASYDYDRKAENGVDRLLVSLVLEEIRQVEPEYGNEQIKRPKQAGDSKTQNAGKQAPQQADDATRDRVFVKHDSVLGKATS